MNTDTLANYSSEQQEAALQLFNLAERHLGTGGGNAAAKLLLGLYNGRRFPFDLTELRRFDLGNLDAAMTVIRMDAIRTWCEVHELLNAIRGPWARTGAVFERWAYAMKLPGRCKKDTLDSLPIEVPHDRP